MPTTAPDWDDPSQLNLHGALATAARRFDEAERLLRRAIAINPREPNYHCNLGEAFRRQGRFDAAIAAFGDALRLSPRLAMAHNNLGAALAAIDRLPDAIDAYRSALAIDPADARA
ncbi:MAG: tetratricopeptide repeat protein, partial [Phycisphaerae bacterium]|nr:tetratricopeptide repeat protein [Phycisphaerae bacterium]